MITTKGLLRKIATEIRKQIVSAYGGTHGMCNFASELILDELKKYPQFKGELIDGYVCLNGINHYHNWILVNGLFIVDITADQFNSKSRKPLPKVMIASKYQYSQYKPSRAVPPRLNMDVVREELKRRQQERKIAI